MQLSSFVQTISSVLGAIFRLKDLKRAHGESGKFNQWAIVQFFPRRTNWFAVVRFIQKSHYGVQERLYINSKGQMTPWPASLVLQVCWHVAWWLRSCSSGSLSTLFEWNMYAYCYEDCISSISTWSGRETQRAINLKNAHLDPCLTSKLVKLLLRPSLFRLLVVSFTCEVKSGSH